MPHNGAVISEPTTERDKTSTVASLVGLGRRLSEIPEPTERPRLLLERLEAIFPRSKWCWTTVSHVGDPGRLLYADGRLAPAANRHEIAGFRWRRTAVDTGTWTSRVVLGAPETVPRVMLVSGIDPGQLGAVESDVLSILALLTVTASGPRPESDAHLEHLRLLGEASGGLVHELKSPLGGILSTLTVLRRRLAEDPRSLEVVGLVEREVERLRDKVINILGFIRVDREPTTLGSLQQVIHQAVSATRAELDEAGVTLELDLSDRVPTVMCDVQPMRQAIQNLLTNAREAMTTGGRITVRLRADDEREPPGAELTVADSGPGFPGDLVARAFEPFVTSKTLGTGLGLANVARIVGDHGGQITARNRTGGGAMITIRLPLIPGGHS
jgi:signal transduction histidine kinase